MMDPFQTLDLEQVNIDVESVGESALVVAVLKNMSLWKGEFGN